MERTASFWALKSKPIVAWNFVNPNLVSYESSVALHVDHCQAFECLVTSVALVLIYVLWKELVFD